MAQLIRADGTTEEIKPTDGCKFSLAEMQTLVGGYIELAGTHDGRILVLDEEGKLKDKRTNSIATALYKYGSHDQIVGDVIVGTDLEINGPPEEEEEDDESDLDEQVRQYTVIVGNLGVVYEGPDRIMARENYDEYVEQSKSGRGRAANEPVTLMQDNLIVLEHHAKEVSGE